MRLLLVSGSTRARSTNQAALATIAALAPQGAEAHLYTGLAELPAFNPDDDHEPLPAPVVALRAAIDAADAVVICTPEYAGTLPGSFKNLLDWTVGSTVLTDKPVAWVNVAAPGRGGGALGTLTTVLGYVTARVVEAACLTLPIGREDIGDDSLVVEPARRAALARVWAAFG
ncbi:MAG: NAD(P)H-dependent oxidoreductase [Myxococcaceae bacterium]|nr:MAG: NAD(P)H-dependent oxidoreductase [Myxococcaceae bacterium]